MTVSSRSARVTLPADDQIRIEREFAAPRGLVYRTLTTPELVRRWWHANRGEMTVCEIDLHVGGRFRYAMVTPQGLEVAFHGTYLEIVPEERIVTREIYEGVPEGVSEEDAATIDTATLDERDGLTTLTILVQAANGVARDAILASGMEDGLQDALDLLEQTAAGLR
jgi:uncharacterized protein YndB with AHSA1/START domain